MKRTLKFSMLLSFILSGCAALLHTRSDDIFLQRALKRVPSNYESEWWSEWQVRHTFMPYATEMMRMYLKSKGFKVPDTTWFNYSEGKNWILTHKSMFNDTILLHQILNLFSNISQSTGFIITDRIERARFEWEIDLGDTTIYWYAEPRKIMAVFIKKVLYFTKPFCNEGKNRHRILVAFPSTFSGRIQPFNSPYYAKSEDIDSVLVFFFEGRWDKSHMKYLLSPISIGPDPIFCQFVGKNCIRYMTGMYFLKDGTWYFAYPFSTKFYKHPTDMLWDIAEDPSFYMWGKSKKDYRVYYRPPFSDTLLQDVLKFIGIHAGEISNKGR